MGIVALLRPFFTFTVNCDVEEGTDNDCADIYIAPEDHFDGTWNEWSTQPVNFLSPEFGGVCDEGRHYDEDEDWCYDEPWHCSPSSRDDPPPRYIGIVFDETDTNLKAHVEGLMDIIYKNYGEGDEYEQCDPDTYGPNRYNTNSSQYWGYDYDDIDWDCYYVYYDWDGDSCYQWYLWMMDL